MSYNPIIHHRHSIRLKGYDYSQAGLYFVTICCRRGEKFFAYPFGKIENGKMILNECGKIAMQCWLEIPQHFPHAVLHEYVIMPNHVHGIIELIKNGGVTGTTTIGAKNFSPLHPPPHSPLHPPPHSPLHPPPHPPLHPSPHPPLRTMTPGDNVPNNKPRGTSRTVGSIVRGFKIGVTIGVKNLSFQHSPTQPIWQRNYWERIIRDEQSYQRIANYIINNPANWGKDKFYNK